MDITTEGRRYLGWHLRPFNYVKKYPSPQLTNLLPRSILCYTNHTSRVIPKQAREIFDIHPGDTLVLLGDEKRGIAIPPKTMFSQFAAAVFETEEEGS